MLILKHLPISANNIKVAYLHHKCPLFATENISSFAQIEIHGANKSIFANLQIVSDDNILTEGEVGLNDEAFTELGIAEGKKLNVGLVVPSPGLEALIKKVDGQVLSSAEYEKIFDDMDKGRLSFMQASSFFTSCHNAITNHELAAISGLLINKKILTYKKQEKVASFCSLGGMGSFKAEIVASFVAAAAGIKIVKPVLGDKKTPFFSMDLDFTEIKKQLNVNNIAFFNAEKLSENKTGKLLAQIGKHINIKQNYFKIASIFANAVSYGITHLLLEVAIGKTESVQTINEGIRLRGIIEHLGDLMGLIVEVVFIDAREPLGNNFGVAFETEEIAKVLQNADDAPADVRERVVFLVGRMFDLVYDSGKRGYEQASELLKSGKALEIYEKTLQNYGLQKANKKEAFRRDVLAAYEGVISEIDTKVIAQIAEFANKTDTSGSGLVLYKKVGDKVKSGEILYTIYSVNNIDFDAVNTLIERDNGYNISIN